MNKKTNEEDGPWKGGKVVPPTTVFSCVSYTLGLHSPTHFMCVVPVGRALSLSPLYKRRPTSPHFQTTLDQFRVKTCFTSLPVQFYFSTPVDAPTHFYLSINLGGLVRLSSFKNSSRSDSKVVYDGSRPHRRGHHHRSR